MNFRLSFFKKLILYSNLAAGAMLGVALLAPHQNPDSAWVFSFFGLAFPILVVVNLVFILAWLFLRKGWFIISLAILVIGWKSLFTLVALNIGSNTDDSGTKIISYNVQNFDLYNWKENELSRDRMIHLVSQKHPEIICFQEFYSEETIKFNNLQRVKDSLKMPYHYFQVTHTIAPDKQWGIATFSKLPILDKGELIFPNSKNNRGIYTDISLNGLRIRIFNIHLQSIHFDMDDYEYISGVRENREVNPTSSRRIMGKLKRAYQKRAVQARIVASSIAESPYPVVICGDFNDTPISYAYYTIRYGADSRYKLKDAFVSAGRGIGSTYAGLLPGLRIDYVMCSPELSVEYYETIKYDGSDHYPVLTMIGTD